MEIYIAKSGEDGKLLAAFSGLELIHESHRFSNHKRTDIERWENNKDHSTVYYKDGSSFTVNIERLYVYDKVEHL